MFGYGGLWQVARVGLSWFHENSARRRTVGAGVSARVVGLGGQVISILDLSPIRYHGMLIDLPAPRIEELLANPTVTLARLDEIMYLQPQSIAAFPVGVKPKPSHKNRLNGPRAQRPPTRRSQHYLTGCPSKIMTACAVG